MSPARQGLLLPTLQRRLGSQPLPGAAGALVVTSASSLFVAPSLPVGGVGRLGDVVQGVLRVGIFLSFVISA